MYDQNGNYVAMAGLAVLLLGKFGVTTNVSTIFTIVGGVVSFIGIVKQFIAHRKLAVVTGSFPE